MNTISDAITYSLYKMDEGKFSVTLDYEWNAEEYEGCKNLAYYKGLPLTKCIEIIDNRYSEEGHAPDGFENHDVRLHSLNTDKLPVVSVQTLHLGNVNTLTYWNLPDLSEEEITLLKELDRKEHERKN